MTTPKATQPESVEVTGNNPEVLPVSTARMTELYDDALFAEDKATGSGQPGFARRSALRAMHALAVELAALRPSPTRDAVADAEGVEAKIGALIRKCELALEPLPVASPFARGLRSIMVDIDALRTANTGRAEVLEEAAAKCDARARELAAERATCRDADERACWLWAKNEAERCAEEIRALSSAPAITAPDEGETLEGEGVAEFYQGERR